MSMLVDISPRELVQDIGLELHYRQQNTTKTNSQDPASIQKRQGAECRGSPHGNLGAI